MRIILLFLTMLFLTACNKDIEIIKGIKIGSAISQVKDIAEYEHIPAYYDNENICKLVDYYVKDNGKESTIISVVDGDVSAVTVTLLVIDKDFDKINQKKDDMRSLYGDPISVKHNNDNPEMTLNIFQYQPTEKVGDIRFIHEVYKNSIEGYSISLLTKDYMVIDGLNQVDECISE